MLTGLINVRYLYLHDNRFSGPIPLWLTEMPLLMDLQLQNNMLSGPIPV